MWAKKASTDWRVVQRAVDAAAVRRADGHGAAERAVGAVAHPRRLATIWLKAGKMKSANWISGTGRRPFDGGADRDADDHRLGERRVHHAVAAELVEQAVGGQEDAALLADVLAQDDDRLVAAHLLGQRLADRLDVRHDGHQPSLPTAHHGTPCQVVHRTADVA